LVGRTQSLPWEDTYARVRSRSKRTSWEKKREEITRKTEWIRPPFQGKGGWERDEATGGVKTFVKPNLAWGERGKKIPMAKINLTVEERRRDGTTT